jgi:hypothetical protein
VLLLHIEVFIFENTKISIFGGIVFGQILVDFGSFGQIWANSIALIVVDNMPQLELKS